MAKCLLRGNGVSCQLGQNRARSTPKRIKRFPMFLTNGRTQHFDNVIPNVDGVTVSVGKHPTFDRLTALAVPSLEKTNHHFQHRQVHINTRLCGTKMTANVRLMQSQLAPLEIYIFPTQSDDFTWPQPH